MHAVAISDGLWRHIIGRYIIRVMADADADDADGAILILDLPQESVLSLDGKSVFLKRNDFMGFNNISKDTFHLFTFRAPSSQRTQGIILFYPSNEDTITDNSTAVVVIRRYNPQTEELEDNVDELTKQNLTLSLLEERMGPQRVVSLTHLHSTEETLKWSLLTRNIQLQNDYLQQRHGMKHGTMIWPSNDDNMSTHDDTTLSFKFPPIPVLGAATTTSSHHHEGTKRFLSTLTPSQRTALYLRADDDDDSPATAALQHVLSSTTHHHHRPPQWILCDFGLSFLMLTHLHCYDSFVHWRDVLCFLSLDVSVECMELYSDELYIPFCTLLGHQLPFMDLDEQDNNILHRALKSLLKTLQQSTKLREAGTELTRIMSFLPFWSTGVGASPCLSLDNESERDDDDEDDGPMIVNIQEYEASMNRALSSTTAPPPPPPKANQHHYYAPKYPLLFAAIQSHEDVVMTCSRILDQQQDAGLVREAAAYLEQVEAFL